MDTDNPSRLVRAIRSLLTVAAMVLATWSATLFPVDVGASSHAEVDGVRLNYNLAIANASSGRATVTLTIADISALTFEIEEHGYHGLYVQILSLAAYDLQHNPLLVEHLPDSGTTYFGQRADVWRIQCAGLSEIVVEYTVQPGMMDASHGHRGLIAPDFAVLAGEYVFLVPRGAATASAFVSFSLPSGWIAYAPWPRQGNGFNPSIPEANVIDSLTVSDFALGQFDVHTQMIGTTEVAVATYHGWNTHVQTRLAAMSWNILDYQTSVFGNSVGDYYLAIFCPVAPDGQDIYAGEWSTGQGYSIRISEDNSFWGKWDMFAHQAFHRWNGWAWGMFGYYSWFGEGPTVLYEMKTITELRIDRPYGDMEDELRGYYDTYLNDYVGPGNDRPLASDDLDSFLIYRKSAMVVFLLAKEIYLRTEGEHNLDDFLQVLVQSYGYNAAPCSEECLKAELAALTGADFTQFFVDYVYGTTPLPLGWAFEDSDEDGLSNALEIGWDTHPENEDTDGDSYGDAVEIAAYTNPLDPSSFPHPLYLPVVENGFDHRTLPISIDGEEEDWRSYAPVATDPQGDTSGGPHTDMKAVYVMEDPSYAYVMVEAYDPPLLSPATVELNLAILSASGGIWELHTNINSNGTFFSWADLDGDGEWENYPMTGVRTAWGSVMELRLPLRQLGSPSQVRVLFANFWCRVGGQWTWVDRIVPARKWVPGAEVVS